MQNMLGIKKLSVVVLAVMILTSGLIVLLDGKVGSHENAEVEEMFLGEQVVPTGEFTDDPYTEALYHFDEESGTVLHDETGNHDGVIHGPQRTSGRWDGGLEFNGSNDYINIPDSDELDLDDTDFTIEVWFKASEDHWYENNHHYRIITKWYDMHSTQGGYILNIFTNTRELTFETSVQTLSSGFVIEPGVWYYVAVVYRSSPTSFEFYVNGTLIKSINTDPGVQANTQPVRISGSAYEIANRKFNGTIDEVRISRVARTIEPLFEVNTDQDVYAPGDVVEISAEYFDGPSDINFNIEGPDGQVIEDVSVETQWGMPYEVDENTIALLDFENDNTNIAYDASPNGNDGTIYGNSHTTGRFNTALDFNGLDNYVVIPEATDLDGFDSITVDFWMKPDVDLDIDTPRMDLFYKKRSSGLTCSYFISYGDGNGKLTCGVYSSQYVPGPGVDNRNLVFVERDFLAGQWYHIACTFDKDEGSSVLINGVVEDGTIIENIHNQPMINTGYDLWIGARPDNNFHFDGTLDEIRISNVVRSPLEMNLRHYTKKSIILPSDSLPGNFQVIASNNKDSLSAETMFTVIPIPDVRFDESSFSISSQNPDIGEEVTIEIDLVNDGDEGFLAPKVVWENIIDGSSYNRITANALNVRNGDELVIFHYTWSNQGLITLIDTNTGNLKWQKTQTLNNKAILGADVDDDGNLYLGNGWGGHEVWKWDYDYENQLGHRSFSSSGLEYVDQIYTDEDGIFCAGHLGTSRDGGSTIVYLDSNLNQIWLKNVKYSGGGVNRKNLYSVMDSNDDTIWRAGRDRTAPDRFRLLCHDKSNGNVIVDESWPSDMPETSGAHPDWMPGILIPDSDDMVIIARGQDYDTVIITALNLQGGPMWEFTLEGRHLLNNIGSNCLAEVQPGIFSLVVEDSSDYCTDIVLFNERGEILSQNFIPETSDYRTSSMCSDEAGHIYLGQYAYDIETGAIDLKDVRILDISIERVTTCYIIVVDTDPNGLSNIIHSDIIEVWGSGPSTLSFEWVSDVRGYHNLEFDIYQTIPSEEIINNNVYSARIPVGDVTPPVTTKIVSDPKCGEMDYWVTSETEFSLLSHDEGIGVDGTFYREWYDGSWQNQGSIDLFVDDDTVALWHFDESCGDEAEDSTESANDGLLIDGPEWVEGIDGSALRFDGNGQYVSVTKDTIDFTGDFTIEAWIYIDDYSGYNPRLFSQIFSDGGSCCEDFAFILRPYGEKFKFGFTANFPNTGSESESYLELEEWYYIALTYDGTKLIHYLNGIEDKSEDRVLSIGNRGSNLRIGKGRRNLDNFIGIIDEMRISSIARSTDEIQSIWNSKDSSEWKTYTAPFNLAGAGEHTIEWFSVDYFGNMETVHTQTHYVDDSPPTSSKKVLSPSYGENDLWVTSSTEFNLSATDSGVGVDRILYREWYNGKWNAPEYVVSTQDLVGCWHMNEIQDGKIIDSSEMSFDGSVFGATLSDGISGPGLYFNGNDYIDCGVDINSEITSEITISAWYYATAPSKGHIVSHGMKNGHTNQYALHVFEADLNLIRFVTTIDGNFVFLDADDVVGLNQWYHVACTFDGDERRLYVNGVLVAISTEYTGTLTNTGTSLTIGCDQEHNSRNLFFKGYIDEVMIWSRGLSSDEILQIFENTLFNTYQDNFTLDGEGKHILEWYSIDRLGNKEDVHTQTHFVDNTPPVSEKHVGYPNASDLLWVTSDTPISLSGYDEGVGLESIIYREATEPDIIWNSVYSSDDQTVALWHFDEGMGVISFDASKYNNHGTLINGVAWDDGRYGNCVEFDGNDDFIRVPSSNSISLETTMTIEAWVKVHSIPTDVPEYILAKGNRGGSSSTQYEMWVGTDGKFWFGYEYSGGNSNLQLPGVTEIIPGIWYYVAGSYDGSKLSIYINGTLENEMFDTRASGRNNLPLDIGRADPQWTSGITYLHGCIDELRLSNVARTPSEISLIWQISRLGSAGPTTSWAEYVSELYLSGDGPHLLEWYSVDNLGNVEEPHQQLHVVDDLPPMIELEIEDSRLYRYDAWWVDPYTEIGLEVTDQGYLGGVGVGTVEYRYWNGEWTEWTPYNGKFNIPNYDPYYLEAHAFDLLGNMGCLNVSIHVIDFTPHANAGPDISITELDPTAHFNGSQSTSYPFDITNYTWDFGNGILGFEHETSYEYPQDDGTYYVVLNVTNELGYWDTDVLIVYVINTDPFIAISENQTIVEGDSVILIGNFSDTWMDTHSIEWDFGDGTNSTNSLTEIHAYGDDGVYHVRLTVIDDDGGVGYADTFVHVENEDPTLNLYITETMTLRVAGTPGNRVGLEVIQDDQVVGHIEINRTTGEPNTGELDLSLDLSKPFYAKLYFESPEQHGSNPVWFVINGTLIKLTTFNAKKNDNTTWYQTRDLNLSRYLFTGLKELQFSACALDKGSDDITISWNFGDGSIVNRTFYNNGITPDPDNSPSGNYPFIVFDEQSYRYSDVIEYVALTVSIYDDDGGYESITVWLSITNDWA